MLYTTGIKITYLISINIILSKTGETDKDIKKGSASSSSNSLKFELSIYAFILDKIDKYILIYINFNEQFEITTDVIIKNGRAKHKYSIEDFDQNDIDVPKNMS